MQDFAKPDYGTLTTVTNQYAAMPSLHFGWSLWCGVVIVMLAPKLWMKALGLLHPLFTIAAIVATANHWVLDAAGGALVVAMGFGLTYLLSGPRKLLSDEERTAEPARTTEPARSTEPARTAEPARTTSQPADPDPGPESVLESVPDGPEPAAVPERGTVAEVSDTDAEVAEKVGGK